MKKFLIAGVIALMLTGGAIANEVITKGYISLSTEAYEELSPTTAKISFAIETESKDPQTAADLNREASTKAINAVKSLVDLSKNEQIKTASYYLNPQYIYKDGQRKITGYKASNTLQVTVKDVEKTGKIISTALSNGANSVNNLQFLLDETSQNCTNLIQQASKEAKTRADKIAEAMNTAVTGIKSINASCSSSQSMPTNNYRLMSAKMATSDGAANEATPVEAGKTQIRAYVNAEFFVK